MFTISPTSQVNRPFICRSFGNRPIRHVGFSCYKVQFSCAKQLESEARFSNNKIKELELCAWSLCKKCDRNSLFCREFENFSLNPTSLWVAGILVVRVAIENVPQMRSARAQILRSVKTLKATMNRI